MHPSPTFSFHCRTKIICGKKALEHLPMELQALDSRMPMVLAADKKRAGSVVAAFKGSGLTLAVMEGLPMPPSPEQAAQLAGLYRHHHCDAIIAVGAGALVDLARAVNVLVSRHSDDLAAFAGKDTLAGPLNPMILVPTAGGIALEASGTVMVGKVGIESALLMPDLAVIDTRLAVEEDPKAMAAMAMAAMAHGVEAATGPRRSPALDVYALSALNLVAGHLIDTVHTDRRHRSLALLNAAVLAGGAFANGGQGMVHVLAAMARSQVDVPLGFFLGILTPYCLEYRHLKQAQPIGHLLLDLAGPETAAAAAPELHGAIVVNALHALLFDIDKASRGLIPSTLAKAGLDRGILNHLAEQAAQTHPDLCDYQAAAMVLDHAWQGLPLV